MKRWLFNLAAATSLLLCIGIGVLWARSTQSYAPEMAQVWYSRWPQSDESYSYYVEAASYSDTLALRFDIAHAKPAYFKNLSAEERRQMLGNFPPGLRGNIMLRPAFWEGCSRQSGFGATHHVWTPHRAYQSDYYLLTVRPWLPMAALAVMPAFWVNGFRKSRRRLRVGLCAKCGYDLRATPERCPECGTAALEIGPVGDAPAQALGAGEMKLQPLLLP